ncbi:MAG: carbon dioxide concentrating mechanism protein [Cyanobacteria bacterium J06600_6]
MIYLPPPQPILNKDIRISGDVEVHPTASLASGVILQAAPEGKIVIGADACIGMGAIINAAQDSIEIGSGAIIGSGVLIIGSCNIGSNCCIGTSSTIFQTDVADMTVVEPGSIIGDRSRESKSSKTPQAEAKVGKKAKQNKAKKKEHKVTAEFNHASSSSATVDNFNSTPSPIQTVEGTTQLPIKQNKEPVVGQLYINELLITLFPNSKRANSDL